MPPAIPKGRLEAFSDGVIAVALTIMVLDLHAPEAQSAAAIRLLLPKFFGYVLSFLYVGIYWNNHHHLLHAARHVSGMTLWANLHLLFWLTLIPFVTGWMGETGLGTWPVAAYGVVLLCCALAWQLLTRTLLRTHGDHSPLARALGRGRKESLSVALYCAGIALALGAPRILGDGAVRWAGLAGCLCYGAVAAIWFVPDRRLEAALTAKE